MKSAPLGSLLTIVAGVILCGCHGKENAVGELEKTAAAMSAAAPAAAPAPDANGDVAPPPAEQLKDAISDYKAGKLEDAVTRLQMVRATPTLPPEQRMALQDSVAAVMTELYSRAEKGDQQAIAAIARYEKMQTRER